MGTGVVSHDTELMRNWSNTMGDNSNEYDSLINRLYISLLSPLPCKRRTTSLPCPSSR